MAAAEKIRALGDNIFGYYHPISFNEFYKTVKQNGGSLFNDDFTEFTMDTPENIETLQYMVDMQQKTNVMPTEQQMALMIRECSGIVCLCLTDEKIRELDLPMMVENNTSPFQTAFTISIEAKEGVTTGVSAHSFRLS